MVIKQRKGFYERTKEKDDKGRRIKLALNLNTLEYAPTQRPQSVALGAAKQVDKLSSKVKTFFNEKYADDKGAQLVKRSLSGLFAYVSNRIPEIADDIYSIDDALRNGFAWKVGPFEYWDMVGIEAGIQAAEADGQQVAQWVKDMVAAGHTSFYKLEDGITKYYDIDSKTYQTIPGTEEFVVLDNIRANSIVWENSDSALHDIGDGVLCFEFRSKMNSLGEGVLRGLHQAINIAESGDWKGLVIGNNAEHFSVGANLMAIAMMAYEQDWDELNMAINVFQQTSMRLRYSSIPVVIATQGYVFGGGCEFSMHSDCVMASAESYIGLVEVGVGLIPGGGGTKEFALRASDEFNPGDVQIPLLIEKFKTIAMASVATSAGEAFKFGYLRPGIDKVSINSSRSIGEAKKKVLELAPNYTQVAPRNDIHVLGRNGLGALYVAAESLKLETMLQNMTSKLPKK